MDSSALDHLGGKETYYYARLQANAALKAHLPTPGNLYPASECPEADSPGRHALIANAENLITQAGLLKAK